jgi:ubiquinone/menaquinone biosynthesis C-methylase UbiE
MSKLDPRDENAEQIKFWNGEAGTHWADRNNEMDAMLQPLGAAAIERASPVVGEQVLDIGCGCGGTTLDMTNLLGESGQILGVDISQPMLDLANSKIGSIPDELQSVPSFQLADASTFDFPVGVYDLLFSRFGVMFFANPPAAFANMREALKPGGRLTFLCWGPPEQNDWIMTPLMAAREHLPPTDKPDPKAPGPFAFADKDYVKTILETAGFIDIGFESISPLMKMGRGQSLQETAEFFMEMGPLSRALVDQPDSLLARVKSAITEAIKDRYKNGFVEMGAKCWVVSAVNPTA